jgi:hypothetical protein
MSSSLGPIDIVCDAPPYAIVRAGRGLGFYRPEDVRWCRMSHVRTEHGSRWEMLNPLNWKAALGGGVRTPREVSSSCGLFICGTGAQAIYLLGQCRRCHTVFWEGA